MRRAGPRRKNGDGRPQPESGTRRKQRKQRGERVERGQVEDEPIQMAAELERERRQRSHPPEDRHLHAALAARFVAGTENGPLGRLDRLEKTQRLLLARERALAPRQRGGAHFLERVEGLEVIAVGLAQVLDERELAAAAVAGALRPEAVPAIEAFEKDRFSRERGARRECARGVASFERRGTADRGGRAVERPTLVGFAGGHPDVGSDHPGDLASLRSGSLRPGLQRGDRRRSGQRALFRNPRRSRLDRRRERDARRGRDLRGNPDGNENRFASRRFRLPALFKSGQRDVPRSREGDLARHRSAEPSMAQWPGPCFRGGGGSGAGKQQQAPDCRFGERHPDC